MNLALVLSALLMGLAGSLHCFAMCGAASTAIVSSCAGARPAARWAGLHAGRLTGYAVAGAFAASSVAVLGRLGEWTPALKPLWTLAHLGALALGMWLLLRGRQPGWMERLGRTRQGRGTDGGAAQTVGWAPLRGPAQAGLAGLMWWAWPCGLLQSALMVAALANGPVGGALVMLAFGTTSALGLGAMPLLFRRLGGAADPTPWLIRLSGLMLAGASAWALGHGLWMQIAAYCFS